MDNKLELNNIVESRIIDLKKLTSGKVTLKQEHMEHPEEFEVWIVVCKK